MKYKSLTVGELICKSEERILLLPNFQRDYVWERRRNQKELLASILYDIPIGSLLTLNGESNFFATKELCIRKQLPNVDKETTLYLLDGQQRISTIKSMFFDFFDNIDTWKSSFESLYPGLRTRWYLRVIPNDNEVDVFGWKNLKFNGVLDLNNYSPKEISEFIHYEIINPNKVEQWYHPEYKKNEWYDKKNKEVHISNKKKVMSIEAAERGLIPLYSIVTQEEKVSSTLHYKTLTQISKARIESMKADVEDGKIDIDSVLDDFDEDSIDDAWRGLANDWVNDIKDFLNGINEKEIPIIELSKNEMSRAIYTFEKVNKGGTSLSTYDLVVAKAAHSKELESLTDRIIKLIDKEIEIPKSIKNGLKGINRYTWNPKSMDLIDKNGLSNFMKNQYLNLLSIFSYFEYVTEIDDISLEYIKKDKHLNLESSKINDNTEITIKSLARAFLFLQFKCGIKKESDLNYQLMILPIAYILRNDDNWNSEVIIRKVEYWYWSSLLGGAYRSNQNERCIGDIKKLHKLILNRENKFIDRENRVLNVEDYSNYNTLIFKGAEGKIPPAIYNGIMQYVLSKQPKDFLDDDIHLNTWDIAIEKEYYSRTKEKNIKLKVQDHHICPLSGATKLGQSSKELRDKQQNSILNSPLNRTLISTTANNAISDKSAQDYFKYVSKSAKYGHCIPSPIDEKYKRNPDEANDVYYERVIKERYNEILRDLSQELDELKNS